MQKIIVAVGGGELKSKQTLEIDRYIANLGKARAGANRANALFLPTASHDLLPYFNSFRKIYTSVFDIKVDVALTCKGADIDKIKQKIERADIIYAGGGDTVFMIEKWREVGLDKLLFEAFQRGVIFAGVSAGAICWFENMYSDSVEEGKYAPHKGLGWIAQNICPHYNLRQSEFDEFVLKDFKTAYALEDLSAAVFIDGEYDSALSCGGAAYYLEVKNNALKKIKLTV